MNRLEEMPESNPRLNQTTVFSGKIGEVIHTQQSDGRVFERYRRPPGTRLVIVSPENNILITREHRHEIQGADYRLPGGKVRDSLEDYRKLLESDQDITVVAEEAAIKEALEETGLIIKNPTFLTKATAGATVEWDLYYFFTDQYTVSDKGQQLEHDEDIEVLWMSPAQIREIVQNGEMQEWRSVGVLLGSVLPRLETIS